MVHISNQDADSLLKLLSITFPKPTTLREENALRTARLALKRMQKKRSKCSKL